MFLSVKANTAGGDGMCVEKCVGMHVVCMCVCMCVAIHTFILASILYL